MNNIHYKELIESLKLLALPFKEQLLCFPEFADVPWEVLDTFDNSFLLLPKLIEDEKFKYNVIANIIRLHNFINLTCSNPSFKNLDYEQFDSTEEWNKIRIFAMETLTLIGEPLEKPDIKYI